MIREFELEVLEAEAAELRDFPEFEFPIVHFATDPAADPFRMLPCGIVADHRNGKIVLWNLHTEKNFQRADELRNSPNFLFRHARNAQEAHCCVPCPDGTYLVFFEKSSIGVRFDPKNRRAFLFDAPEVYGKGAVSFGITAYANPDPDADFFYASYVAEMDGGIRKVANVELAYDLSRFRVLRESVRSEELRLNAPHMTRANGGRVYDSHFKDVSYSVPEFPERILSRHELVDSGMRKVFGMYGKISGLSGGAEFEDFCETEDASVTFRSEAFRDFVDRLRESLGCAHLNDLICEKIHPGTRLLPGKISHFAISDPEDFRHAETSKGSPAHFEFSEDGERVYVSSHNFDILCDGLRYFWPAAIDAFGLGGNGKMEKRATFETPEGYRFTSHRFFRNENGEFVATIGQPNRFYVINAATMRKAFHVDLAENRLHDFAFMRPGDFVRSTHADERYRFFRPFEISKNGRTAYVPHRTGALHVSLVGPSAPVRLWNYSSIGGKTAEILDRLRVLNAHCYSIPNLK